jgi:hypothetical protein
MESMLARCGLMIGEIATDISRNLEAGGTSHRVKEISRTSFLVA